MNLDRIEIAPFGNLLVYKRGYTADYVRDTIMKKKLGGLRIFSVLKEEKVDNVDFLKDYGFLEALDITSMQDFDFGFLHHLKDIKRLSINVQGNNNIDLSTQTNLEKLSINWRKRISGIDSSPRLSSLCLIEFKERTVEPISSIKSLTELKLKTALIETLDGLNAMEQLQKMSIGNCKKLVSVKGINGLPNLRHLELDTCPKVGDYDYLTNLPRLESLTLTDCKDISSIKFIANFPLLKKLVLLGNTVIEDGDLMPAKRIESVEYKHHRHYNVRVENETYNQTIKDNLRKIKKWFE